MNKIFVVIMISLLAYSAHALAADDRKILDNYKCTNKSGKVGIGTGRLSYANEYSPFLKKTVLPAEYVIFRYDGLGTEYWFKKHNCQKM